LKKTVVIEELAFGVANFGTPRGERGEEGLVGGSQGDEGGSVTEGPDQCDDVGGKIIEWRDPASGQDR
jgi:hypothetical protein